MGLTIGSVTTACSGNELTILAELDPSIRWVGAIFLSEDGSWEGATALHRREAGAPAWLLTQDAPFDQASELVIIGFRAEDLGALAPSDEGEVSSAPLAPPQPGDRRIRPVLALRGPLERNGTLRDLESITPPEVTAPWLAPCPRNACAISPLGPSRNVRLGADRSDVRAAVPLAAEPPTVLVITRAGGFFRATSSAAVELTDLSTAASFSRVAARDDGELWLTTIPAEERVVRYVPGAGLTTVTRLPDEISLMRRPGRIAVSPSGPFELYYAGTLGIFARFDGRAWTTLYQATKPPGEERMDVDVVWLGPGRAAALFYESREIVFVDGDRITPDDHRWVLFPRAMGWVPGLGLVVVAIQPFEPVEPELYVREGASWRRLGREAAGLGFHVSDLWPLGAGLVYGGISGRLSYYRPGVGGCPGHPLTSLDIHDIQTVGGLAFVSTDQAGTAPSALTVVELLAEPPLTGCEIDPAAMR
ncbi:MAG: hypothetical protein IT384_28380 [Deltaproteobacteria bacterium]|nr:hypothetical protein [Deltaproteobacteria bacterium]